MYYCVLVVNGVIYKSEVNPKKSKEVGKFFLSSLLTIKNVVINTNKAFATQKSE